MGFGTWCLFLSVCHGSSCYTVVLTSGDDANLCISMLRSQLLASDDTKHWQKYDVAKK
jgi:hypothetical protein